MVRSAFLATCREFSASRPSSLAVNSSISLRSLSSRLRSRSVKSFALEVKCVQFSFQPPPVPAVGVQRRDVVLALARHFEARLPQGGDDFVAIPHRSVLDTLEQVVPDQVAGGGFEPEAGPQPRRLDVGAVSGLLHSGPLRVVGAAPAALVVEGVRERVERPPPTRRRDVEAPAGLQVAPCREDMHVSAAAALAVQHGGLGVAGRAPAPPTPFPRRRPQPPRSARRWVGRPVPRRSRRKCTCARSRASRPPRPPCPDSPAAPRRPRAASRPRPARRGGSRRRHAPSRFRGPGTKHASRIRWNPRLTK